MCVCVSRQFMWAGCIIKINDIACPLPKQRHTHTHTHIHTATNPSWRLRLCFSKRTIFCLPLWLSLSHSLFISPSISISLSAQNAKLLHFSLAPLLPCSSTHLVINSKHIKPTVVPRYSPDRPSRNEKNTHTHRLNAHTWVKLQNGFCMTHKGDTISCFRAKNEQIWELIKGNQTDSPITLQVFGS